MNVYISSDHGGFELKNKILEALKSEFNIIDLGPSQLNEDDDYPDFALPLAQKVAEDSDDRGVLICRSGNGMAIAANKVKGAYAALCFTVEHAKFARSDDNANIVCLDSDYDTEDSVQIQIVREFLTTGFSGEERHKRRVEKIKNFER